MAVFDWGNLGTQLSQPGANLGTQQEQSANAPNYLGPLIAAMMQMHQEGRLFPQGQQVAANGPKAMDNEERRANSSVNRSRKSLVDDLKSPEPLPIEPPMLGPAQR